MPIISLKTGTKSRSLLVGNAFFNPSSYESIASATGTGSSGTITFSSIPSTYASLQIRFTARVSSGGETTPIGLYFLLNGDTGSNYTQHDLSGNGATASATGYNTSSVGGEPFLKRSVAGSAMTSDIVGVGIIDILDYASTTKAKTVRSISGLNFNTASTNEIILLQSNLWTSTSAINSITIKTGGGQNFATSTVVSLYGIKG